MVIFDLRTTTASPPKKLFLPKTGELFSAVTVFMLLVYLLEMVFVGLPDAQHRVEPAALVDVHALMMETTASSSSSSSRANNDRKLSSTTTILHDNFHSRPHIPRNQAVPLLVGGSDGSGTRSVVELLASLGVPMIINDAQSLDYHAEDLFEGEGWPPLAKMVLRTTHSAKYEVDDINPSELALMKKELSSLLKDVSMRMKAVIDIKKKLEKRGKSVAETTLEQASGVEFGIKAPVSMLLVPAFQMVWPQMRFIHVVRDGRDVSFSENQSPVTKLYNLSYADGSERFTQYTGDFKCVKAMQLWNDWNTDLLEWEKLHADGEHFDYLVVRAEDLIDPESRFQAISRVADFVGSSLTPQDICCLSKEHVKDLGQSRKSIEQLSIEDLPGMRGARQDSRRLKFNNRYGKWQHILANKTEVLAQMHREGGKGLETFGYKPLATFMDGGGNGEEDSFECHAKVTCADNPSEKKWQFMFQGHNSIRRHHRRTSGHRDVLDELKNKHRERLVKKRAAKIHQ